MNKRRFLIITDTNGHRRVAIPIKRIIQMREYRHHDVFIACITYYTNKNDSSIVYTEELFQDIMKGNYIFEL